jgi:hypothetical protein
MDAGNGTKVRFLSFPLGAGVHTGPARRFAKPAGSLPVQVRFLSAPLRRALRRFAAEQVNEADTADS